MGEALLLEGGADAVAFETYVEQLLAPSLHPGQIVILDNLSIHQGRRVRQAIEAKGCHLLFLPAYSPDFSPIEEASSKLKTHLRRVGARTREALQEAITADETGKENRLWIAEVPTRPTCCNGKALPPSFLPNPPNPPPLAPSPP